MAMTPNDWDLKVWTGITDKVREEISKIRVSTKVFDKKTYGDSESPPRTIPNELIDFEHFSISDIDAKGFVEINAEFMLSQHQVENEADGEMLHTAQTLATMVAKTLALAEDAYFFQSSDRERGDKPPKFPSNVTIKDWKKDKDFGLLAEANPGNTDEGNLNQVSPPIMVPKSKSLAIWGENTFKAVAEGMAKLEARGQAGGYALFLPTKVYADIFSPPSPASLVATVDKFRDKDWVDYHSSPVLPPDEGLLFATRGMPIMLFIGPQATVKYSHTDGKNYFFQVVERVQYVVRDPRSMVLLKFAKD